MNTSSHAFPEVGYKNPKGFVLSRIRTMQTKMLISTACFCIANCFFAYLSVWILLVCDQDNFVEKLLDLVEGNKRNRRRCTAVDEK